MNNIITISGDPGSGKSTVRNALKKSFEKQGKEVIIYSIGDIFRQLAEEKGMTVTEFNQFLETHKCNVDESLEKSVENFGKKVKEENDENKIYIVDARLAWHQIPEAFKVRLTITDKIAAERIFNDKTRGEEDRYPTVEAAMKATIERKKCERDRYITLYGEEYDIANENNFDININTAFVDPEEIAQIIMSNMKRREQGLYVCKTWASQKMFLPTQVIGDLMHTFSEIKGSIKNNGYNPNEYVQVLRKNGVYFLTDGHHRCFGAANCGINLVPYNLDSKDKNNDELVPTDIQIETIRNILGPNYRSILYDYEEVWRNKITGEFTYKYEDAYPGIYGLTKQKKATVGNSDGR